MRKEIVFVLILWAVAFVCGFLVCRCSRPPQVITQERVDTLIIRDTSVLTEVVWRTVEKTVTDTVVLRSVDSVFVEVPLPVDYVRTAFPDAEVYHHGFRSVVDSVKVYPETRYVTKTVTERIPAPRVGIGLNVGYGVSREGFSPYVGIGVTYNLLSLCDGRRK